MPAIDDSRTLGRARLSFAREADIDEFVETLQKFERGDISPDEWRAFRLVRGTYGQRQAEDAQMLRVKIPQGILSRAQLFALADVAERYSRGFGHITTRQNIQFHFVRLHDVEPAMRHLAETGITTREACGNSVRNITGCPYAGVAHDEVFDVTPYAEALTRFLLRHPLSSTLPRKFKIAFEGCAEDHVYTPINDLGWRARIDETGRRGFRVTAGGGTAILPTSGGTLFEFLPAGEIFDVAEAVLRVFQRLGDYRHKQRNRMKFLIRAIGWDAWLAEFHRALDDIRATGGTALPFDPEDPPVEQAPDWEAGPRISAEEAAARVARTRLNGPGLHPNVRSRLTVIDSEYDHWLCTNVRPQKQAGYSIVTVSVPLGDLTSDQMRVLGDLAGAYGDGLVRVTPAQDLVFRWVPLEQVPELYRRLVAIGLALPDANTIADVTSCPGAESCRLAVTQSRGLGRLLEDHLRANPQLVEAAPDASIKISGCPNGCGQHHISTFGFQGSVRKVGGQAAPHYFVLIGGSASDDTAQFGRLAAKVPARRMTETVERLIDLYVTDRSPGESATAFFGRIDVARVKTALADIEHLDPSEADAADFIDLGEDHAFVPEVLDGECSA